MEAEWQENGLSVAVLSFCGASQPGASWQLGLGKSLSTELSAGTAWSNLTGKKRNEQTLKAESKKALISKKINEVNIVYLLGADI